MALHNLITTNIDESFVSAHNNSINGFLLFNTISRMDYIRINYGTVLPKQLQDNDIALGAQWYPTTPITILFTYIEY